MDSSEIPIFPNLKDTISKIKEDFTFEKQYNTLIDYDAISPTDPDFFFIKNLLNNTKPDTFAFFSPKESKGIGCFLGLVIGDALGNLTDGFPLDNNRNLITSFENYIDTPRIPLGLYSDDSAMALCIADSLLSTNYQYDASDIKHRFLLWWYEGLNNGKALVKADPKFYKAKMPLDFNSFGIGTTIWCSLLTFIKNPNKPQVSSKDSFMPKNSDGNGSIMRLAPIVLAFNDNFEKMTEISRDQSFLTHHGEEAAECCQLLANILSILLNEETKNLTYLEEKKPFFLYVCKKALMQADLKLSSVICLAQSQQEEEWEEDDHNSCEEDRNWNWMDQNFNYSKTRIDKNPTCIGVYCMDCLAMALHITLYSKDFKEAILKSVNIGGDSDTLAAMVGQIAGCFYGISDFMLNQYQIVRKWDQDKTFIRAYKLINHKKL